MNDLYREIEYPPVGDGTNPDDVELYEGWQHIREAVRIGELVKVEPCVHGNYAHHAVIELQQVDASGREDWRYVGECDGTPEVSDV